MAFYLDDIPLTEALQRLNSAVDKVGKEGVLREEEIFLDEKAVGRITAAPVWAKISSPHYHSSAMDGFAVRSVDTDGASETVPVRLKLDSQAAYVDTGDPLPSWANAVIPIEQVEPIREDGSLAENPRAPELVRIRTSFPPWKNVRPMGEDMVTSQLVIPSGQSLRPVDLGAIAGCGHHRITVAGKPKVAIIPTGTELIEIGQPAFPGDIIEYNSIVLAGQIEEWGGEATRYPITEDDYSVILSRVKKAARSHDLVLIIAGSSAGSEDYTAEIVDELGELLVHGVAVRPGHPVIVGMIGEENKVPAIGVPGFPVSAALTGEIFVEPLMTRWLGRPGREPAELEVTLTRKITSPAGDEDYVRVAVGEVGERIIAAPLSRGSGVITSLVRADGIMVIPRGSQGYPAGERVQVKLYRSLEEIKKTIIALGSHDLTLDLLAQYLSGLDRRLSSANLGSLGGLIALKRGHAHLAGSHLLDPKSGDYNLSYIEEYLPDLPVMVVSLVERVQGLFIREGNPADIEDVGDLARTDISFINRQRGAGTRILLDFLLQKKGIDPEDISGYGIEEYTHLTAAAAVASGRADCALGIQAAAEALNLDFIPLEQERYDLVIPLKFREDDLLEPLFAILGDQEFRRTVGEIPGYDSSSMGEIIAVFN